MLSPWRTALSPKIKHVAKNAVNLNAGVNYRPIIHAFDNHVLDIV